MARICRVPQPGRRKAPMLGEGHAQCRCNGCNRCRKRPERHNATQGCRDRLINSAGIAGALGQKTGNVDYESWAHVFNVSTMGPLRGRCHVVESLMRVRRVSQLKSCGGDDFAPRLHGASTIRGPRRRPRDQKGLYVRTGTTACRRSAAAVPAQLLDPGRASPNACQMPKV
jgi:hypothetical protein